MALEVMYDYNYSSDDKSVALGFLLGTLALMENLKEENARLREQLAILSAGAVSVGPGDSLSSEEKERLRKSIASQSK